MADSIFFHASQGNGTGLIFPDRKIMKTFEQLTPLGRTT
jgi:hypothetical protein